MFHTWALFIHSDRMQTTDSKLKYPQHHRNQLTQYQHTHFAKYNQIDPQSLYVTSMCRDCFQLAPVIFSICSLSASRSLVVLSNAVIKEMYKFSRLLTLRLTSGRRYGIHETEATRREIAVSKMLLVLSGGFASDVVTNIL